MNKLFNDFLSSKEILKEFFLWLPREGIDGLVRIVQNQILKNCSTTTTPFIITGQQPAVFGGPLYTIYKIITSIKLSSNIKDRYSLHILPLFWAHSWDHDWEEVCSTNFLTYNYEILPFSYTPETSDRGKSLYKVRLNKNYFIEQIPEIFRNIKGSEFSSQWQEFLINSVLENDNLSDWGVSILKEVLKKEQLTWFEPHKTTDFHVFKQLIEISIDNHHILFEEFNKTSLRLTELGYKPQVHKLSENAFFFLEENGFRSRIKYLKDVFYSEISNKKYSTKELKEILNYEPERFSPNLILRCIYQQMLFPCVIYVGGPAEVAYWAQFKDLFSFFKLSMPIIYPRKRFVLVPPKIKKWVSELDLDMVNLPQLYEGIKKNKLPLLSEIQKSEIEKARMKFMENAITFFNNLLAIFNNDVSLENFRKTYLSRIEAETQKVIENIIKSHKSKNEIFQKHLCYILNTIFPNGIDQERFFSPFSFIPEYNYDFIKMIMNKSDIENFETGIIEL